jgi:hypothetical protein
MKKEPCPIAQFDWRTCAGRFLLSHGFVMQSPPVPIGQVQDLLESFGREMLSAIVQEKEHFRELAQDAINRMPSATYERLASLPVGESRWISVEEKLPEEDATVLAAIPLYDNDRKLTEVEVLHCTYWIVGGQKIFTTCEGEEYLAGEVTRWMSWPKPSELGLGESRQQIDKAFEGMSTDEAYQKEMLRIAEERPSSLVLVLSAHWLTEIHCDHEAKTDEALCYCGWRSPAYPSVGRAVEHWARHVSLNFTRGLGESCEPLPEPNL